MDAACVLFLVAWGSTPIQRVNPIFRRGEWCPPENPGDAVSLSTVPRALQSHRMSLLRVVAMALATLFLFVAGFAAAGEEIHPDHDHHHHKILLRTVPRRSDDGYLSFLSFKFL